MFQIRMAGLYFDDRIEKHASSLIESFEKGLKQPYMYLLITVSTCSICWMHSP